MSEHDPDMLVVLTTARTEFEAQTLAEALRARGIRAEVFATAASSLQWEAGFTDPIKVMVRRADVAEAEKVRATLKMDSVDIDWDEVDTGAGAGAEQDDAPTKKSAQVTVFVVGLFFGMMLVSAIAGLFSFGIANAIYRLGMEFDGHTSVPMYVGWAGAVLAFALLWRGSRKVREEARESSTPRRTSPLKVVNRIGWSILALLAGVMVFTFVGSTMHFVFVLAFEDAGFDDWTGRRVPHGSSVPLWSGVIAAIATLWVLVRAAKKRGAGEKR